MWNVSTIVTGLVSLMNLENAPFHNWINNPKRSDVQNIAKTSRVRILANKVYQEYFSEHKELLKTDPKSI